MPHHSSDPRELYWNAVSEAYQSSVTISTDDFHYGPLLPGERDLRLLPAPLAGRSCLEIGAGAGQNSLYLAGLGARCTATDISERQLDHGRHLARALGRDIRFLRADIDALPLEQLGPCDLVHSAYALPFSHDPARAVHTMAGLLKPGGTLLIVTSHPVYSGEWVDLDDGEEGLFLPDYFRPPPDIRLRDDGDDEEEPIACRFHPVSDVLTWFIDAGLHINRVAEPRPLDVPALSPEQRVLAAPYYSEDWMPLWPVLRRVPLVLIVRAVKPT